MRVNEFRKASRPSCPASPSVALKTGPRRKPAMPVRPEYPSSTNFLATSLANWGIPRYGLFRRLSNNFLKSFTVAPPAAYFSKPNPNLFRPTTVAPVTAPDIRPPINALSCRSSSVSCFPSAPVASFNRW